ncbi:hypothetical protein F5Y09DRAFT_332375 [Xylaria sp. FL1042]|nr:hypothetical protein F5Y09DRAFT_332375 [Xylaria sp. FL1042]
MNTEIVTSQLESQRPMLIAASAITIFLTLGGICTRTYTKAAIINQFGLTDCILLLTGALFIAFKGRAFTTIRILIWASLLFYTAAFLTFLLACIPRGKISNPDLPGVCINTESSITVTGAINVLSDLAILIAPVAVIWKLQTPLKRKIGAAAVFGVGIMLGEFTAVILVACFPYSPRLYQHLAHKYRNARNPLLNDGTQNIRMDRLWIRT